MSKLKKKRRKGRPTMLCPSCSARHHDEVSYRGEYRILKCHDCSLEWEVHVLEVV